MAGVGVESRLVGLDEDAAVTTHRHRRANLLGGVRVAHRHGDRLAVARGVDEAQGLLDRDLAEGIHLEVDVVEVDARAVRLELDLRVGIGDSFRGDENLHADFLSGRFRTVGGRSEGAYPRRD